MQETIAIIDKYLEFFPEDEKDLLLLKKQTQESKNFFNRKNFIGHVVANALIINGNKVLTIFHNKLQMYIQPGGHVDVGESVIGATIREVKEETGINDIVLDSWHKESGIPIFIESHLIPENLKKSESEHFHHDFMYIFRTSSKDVNLQLEEVSDFEWVDIDDVIENNQGSFIGKSLKRLVKLKIL